MTFNKLILLFSLIATSYSGFSQITGNSSFAKDSIDWSKPKEYVIAGIQVECSQFTDKNVVRLLSGLSADDKIQIPGDKIGEAIKNLWKQGLFEDVQIYLEKTLGDKAFLKIVVVDKPKLTKFSFNSVVRKNDADEIRGKIRFVTGKVVTDYTLGYIKNIVKI